MYSLLDIATLDTQLDLTVASTVAISASQFCLDATVATVGQHWNDEPGGGLQSTLTCALALASSVLGSG